MKSELKAEVIRQLEEAFEDLCSCGGDTLKMAHAVGGAQFLIASALGKLGVPRAMDKLDAMHKEIRMRLSNSAAPIGPCAAKESAPVVPSSDGERGVTLASDLDASASEKT